MAHTSAALISMMLCVRCGSKFSAKMCFGDVMGARLVVTIMAGTAVRACSTLGAGRDAHELDMHGCTVRVP